MKKIILLILVIILFFMLVHNLDIKNENEKITEYKNNNITVEISNKLTPVVYDEQKQKWRKIKENEEWFNYDEQKWANAVLLKDKDHNSTYLDLDKDVLSMFVYIPRYSYTIKYPYGKGKNTSSNLPGAIDIKFVTNEIKEEGKASYEGNIPTEYKTHPAFSFGDKELNGIWVGKFEVSADEDSNCYKEPNIENCNNLNIYPRTLPNKKALTNQDIYHLFNTINKYSDEINDIHMIKNTEWGAITYLTQSVYGKYGNKDYTQENKEVYQNKSTDYITGLSNGTPSSNIINEQIEYNISKMNEKETITRITSNNKKEYKIINNKNFTIKDNYFISNNSKFETSSLIISFSLENKGNLEFDISASTPNVEIEEFNYILKNENDIIKDTKQENTSIGGIKRGINEQELKYDHINIELEKGNYTLEFNYEYIYTEYTDIPKSLNKGYVKDIIITEGSIYKKEKQITQENGTGASTTGNIYGIYDMSGGAVEYVMGLYQSKELKEFGTTINNNYSGFNNKTKPDKKYYDIYTTNDINTACNNQKCYGIGYSETKWWYEDIATDYALPTKEFPWIFRGDANGDLEGAGIFMNFLSVGEAQNNFTSRQILTLNF